jgi:putative ABC transport system permease protein
VLFKVLGTKRRRIAQIYATEFGLLGIVTAVISAVLGTLISWAVVTWLMRLEWAFHVEVVTVTVAACMVLTLVLGFAGTWRQLGQKVASYLRNE